MKRLFTLYLLIAPLLLSAQADFDKEKLDKYLNTLQTKNKAISAVVISKGNEIIYSKYSGFLSPGTKTPFNSTTKFRVGSISKTFTAAVIFQLIEEGKLTLDTKLNTFYPDFLNGDKITIAHLLSHQSGIHNYTAMPDFSTYIASGKSLDEMYTVLESMTSDFEPGTNTSYSNSGYFLLGLIIDRITGISYEENIKTRIIDKIGLDNTEYGDKIETDKNEAYSLVLRNDEWALYPVEWDMSTAYAAGAIVSTASDLNKFMYALFNNQIVSESSVTKMKEIERGLGHGVFAVPFYGRQAFGHNGHIDNFDSGSYYFESDNVNVTVLTTGITIAYNDVLVGVLSIYFGLPYEIPAYDEQPITLPVEQLKAYEGTFTSDDFPLDITVKVNGDQLTAQATGQGAFPLTAFSEKEFRYATAGIVMIFGDKDGDAYTTFIMKQGGGQVSYKKKDK